MASTICVLHWLVEVIKLASAACTCQRMAGRQRVRAFWLLFLVGLVLVQHSDARACRWSVEICSEHATCVLTPCSWLCWGQRP